MIKLSTLFLTICKWYRLLNFFIVFVLASGCVAIPITTSYLREPISDKIKTEKSRYEVTQDSVAILPPVSWVPAELYYLTDRKFLMKYLKKHSKSYQLRPSYLMTTWAEAAAAASELGSEKWQERIKEKSLELKSLWISTRRKTGEILGEHGFDIVSFREVDLAIRKIMPKFWDEDSRTGEKIISLCKETKSSYVVSIEVLYSLWVESRLLGGGEATVRVEVYNQKGESEFVGLASSRATTGGLQKIYGDAVMTALSQWLGPSEHTVQSTRKSLEVHEVVIDGFWVAEGYNGTNYFRILPGSSILVITQASIPTQPEYARDLSNELKKLLEQQGYSVIQTDSLSELFRKPKEVPLPSLYRTTAKLSEIGRSLGAMYVIFCEVRGVTPRTPVVFLKLIDIKTGSVWTQMLHEEKRKIPEAINQEINKK